MLQENCTMSKFVKAQNVIPENVHVHPKVCSFYRDYNYCKFAEYCSFSHNIRHYSNDALEKEIVDIRKQHDLLKEKERNYEKEMIKLENKIIDGEKVFQNINLKI